MLEIKELAKNNRFEIKDVNDVVKFFVANAERNWWKMREKETGQKVFEPKASEKIVSIKHEPKIMEHKSFLPTR